MVPHRFAAICFAVEIAISESATKFLSPSFSLAVSKGVTQWRSICLILRSPVAQKRAVSKEVVWYMRGNRIGSTSQFGVCPRKSDVSAIVLHNLFIFCRGAVSEQLSRGFDPSDRTT